MSEEGGSADAGNPGGSPGEGGNAGASGEGAATWLGSDVPEGMDSFVANKGWKSGVEAVTSYQNLEKLMGADKAGRTVVLPGEGATPDELNAFYNRLGRPEEPAGYDIPLPEGMEQSDFADWARGTFHEAGVSAEAAKLVTEKYNEFAAQSMEQSQQAYEAQVAEDTTALQREWGAAYEEKVAGAKAAAREFGLTDDQVTRMEGALGFADLMRFMSNVGSKLGEATFHEGGGDRQATGGLMTPAEAQVALNGLNSDPKFMEAWLDKSHPGHKDAMERKARLARLAVGEA